LISLSFLHCSIFYFFLLLPHPPTSTLFPYTTLFRSPRHRDGRRQPVRSRRRRQVVVLLSDRAARRDRGTSRHVAWLDVAPRPAARQDPLGSAGGLSTGRREAASHPRTAGIRGALESRPAPDGQAGQVRHDLRTGAREHAV